MKRTVLLLALTLGWSALNASAQSQGDQARQHMKDPAPDEERDAQVRERRDDRRPERRREMQRQHRREMQRRNWEGSREFDGPPPRFGGGRPDFAPRGRGPAWNAPRNREGQPEVCPFCHRP